MNGDEIAARWVATATSENESEDEQIQAFRSLLKADPTRAIRLASSNDLADVASSHVLSAVSELLVGLRNAGFIDDRVVESWPDHLRSPMKRSRRSPTSLMISSLETEDLADLMRQDPTGARVALRSACEDEKSSLSRQAFAAEALGRLFLCRAAYQGDEANMTAYSYEIYFNTIDRLEK